jgi:hypothetical protein
MMTGNVHEMDLDITEDQLNDWNQGQLIQDVMPELSPDAREFLMTGITSDEWDSLMGDDYDTT